MSKVNSMYFSEEAVANGELNKLLKYLMDYSYSDNDERKMMLYCDIHIKPEDCGAFVVEWTQEPWSNEFGDRGGFEYVDCDQLVMREYSFPDNHYEYFETDEQFNEALEEWLEENPGWHKHHTMNVWVHDDKEEFSAVK